MKVSETGTKFNFLKGSGEAGEIIAAINWSQTSLGDMVFWPQSLVTTLGIILHSKFPMLLFWGPDHICFYNDTFRYSLGYNGKHPAALGMPAHEVWAETWHLTKPALDKILRGEPSELHEDQLIPIYRNGKIEDAYWTYSYSPVDDENGNVGGVLVTCTETTDKLKLLKNFEINEKRFFDIVQQTPVGIAIFMGENFTIITANKAYLEIIDREADATINKPLFDILPEVEEDVRPLITEVYKTGIAYNGNEFPVKLNRYGKTATAYFNFTYQPFLEDNVVKGVIVIATDVTSIVEAKHRLEESEQKFRNAVTNSPIAIGIFRGPDLVIEEANNTLLTRLWKREFKDVVGKKLLDAFPELRDQQYSALLRKVYESGVVHRQNEALAYVESWDGRSTFYLDFEYAPLFDSFGEVSGIMITANDVTDKVVARKKIADAEERLRIATEAGDLATFEVNLLTEELFSTPRFNRLFGFDEPIPRYEGVKMIVPEDQPIREKAYNKALKDPAGRLNYEVRLKWQDGSIHWIRMDARFFFDADGKAERLVGTMKEITTEKKALQKIEESEKYFRYLIQEAPVPKALLNGKDYKIEVANDAMLEIWNKGNDIVGKPLLKALPELRGQSYINIIDGVYETGITYKGNERPAYIDIGNGRYKKIFLNLIFKRIESYSQNGFDIIVTGYDVTQQVLARRRVEESENELQKINQRLEIALEAGKLGSYELDLATGNMNCTAQCKANYGLGPDDDLNFSILLKTIAPQHKDNVQASIEKAIKDRTIYLHEYIVYWPNGSMHWVRASGKTTYDESGKPLKIVGVTLDITENKLALQRIEESEQRLNMALEYTNIGTFDLNLQTFELIYTARLVEIFGYPVDAKLTQPQLRDHILPDDRKQIVEKAFSNAIKTGNYFYEARIIRADNEPRWIRTSGRIIYDSDGIPVRMVGTTMDITEEKNEQQRKDDFMGIVTHELKTPLTSVKGFAQFLYERAVNANDNTSATLLDKMVAQINKLNMLVQDLLDITRMEGGKMKFQHVAFNFNELVEEVTEQLSITTPKTIEVQLSDWNGSIIGDRERTGQVLINLLTNAIKYSPKAEKVIVSVEKSNEKVICSVTDFGIGISKENQPFVFDRFYREAEAHASTFPGLGLGLYISSEIIKRQNGEIWVKSEKGKGSVFSFSLPLNTSNE